MFQLKEYQQRALDALTYYFRLVTDYEGLRPNPASAAFYDATEETIGRSIPYVPIDLEEFHGMPYVCLRMPTGAGKTYVAAHAVGTATRDLLQADRSLVLWLVPTTSILDQTIEALRDKEHPYRQAVVDAVGQVRVMDATEALYMSRPVLDTETVIVVSTIQSFRVEDTEGRKVYAANGALMDHFTGLDPTIVEQLDKNDDGTVVPSLANVLRVRRPMVIVDEAHHARTELTFDTLARFRPACILEITATPHREKHRSNILHSVSAAELKAEEMIKLPIELTTQTEWKELLTQAIEQRVHLEQISREEHQETGEYIRPILLLQAEPNYSDRESLDVDTLKKTLVRDFNIPEQEIAIATGSSDDLEGADLLSPTSPLRYVITVQKLQEGWDCPFAYVLCSISQLRSSRAIEQIVGRILRMPQARRKVRDELNKAYAFSASPNFAAALDALKDVLVDHGFERQEADTLVREAAAHQKGQGDHGPLFEHAPSTSVQITIGEVPKNYNTLPEETQKKAAFKNGTLTVRGGMTEDDREELKKLYTSPEAKDAIDQAYCQSLKKAGVNVKAPAERGEKLRVPKLLVRQGDIFEEFEKTHLLEQPWQLSKCEATLPGFDIRKTATRKGLVDMGEKGTVKISYVEELHNQVRLLSDEYGWTVAGLVYWLDHAIPHQDIPPKETGIYLTSVVRHLIDDRDFTLSQLVNAKYALKKAVEQRIDEHRKEAHKHAHQALLGLDEGEGRAAVDPETCFSFPEDYPYSAIYDGNYEFDKHYYEVVGDLNGEEEHCARFLDEHPQVEYWVRNLERRENHSFWLQTSTDKFYPDFVAKLRDDRILVVEYKGAKRWTDEDSKEKRDLGELWARRSDGQCLFIMPQGKNFDAIRDTICEAEVTAS